jgi:phage terminase large subunit-like protein
VPNAFDSVTVQHVSGKASKVSFRAYEQGKKKFMGSRHDHVWPDEEPPQDIWSQMLRSTFSTNGDIAATFTPEEGVTEIVYNFLENLKKGQAVIHAGWDDAPHMDAERRARFLEQIPAHERDMRSKGIPVMGSGVIFPVTDEDLEIESFPIPKHWPKVCGIDFGWEHPFAAVWLAHDRESDKVYVYDCYRESHTKIPVAASRVKGNGSWIPCMWPHDGLVHDKASGRPLADLYRAEGVNMHHEQFSNPPAPGQKEGQGGQGVEVGLMAMLEAMEENRFYVFEHCREWFEEKRIYHRKDGKVVKLRDDLMSATRYAFQMLRHADVNLPRSKPKVKRGLKNW